MGGAEVDGSVEVGGAAEVGGFLLVEEEPLNVLDGALDFLLFLCLAAAASRLSCALLSFSLSLSSFLFFASSSRFSFSSLFFFISSSLSFFFLSLSSFLASFSSSFSIFFFLFSSSASKHSVLVNTFAAPVLATLGCGFGNGCKYLSRMEAVETMVVAGEEILLEETAVVSLDEADTLADKGVVLRDTRLTAGRLPVPS